MTRFLHARAARAAVFAVAAIVAGGVAALATTKDADAVRQA